MPLTVPEGLPARACLEKENILVLTESSAAAKKAENNAYFDRQTGRPVTANTMRPLKVAVLNLMPNKTTTEIQFLRLLGKTPNQVDITFIRLTTHASKNTPEEYLKTFYKPFCSVRSEKFDGLIITGSPVELLDFSEVDYWNELCEVMDWSVTNVRSSLHVCWGAQAGLYHHYGINKFTLDGKISGVYRYNKLSRKNALLRGLGDDFFVPHSCRTAVDQIALDNCRDIEVLAVSPEAGAHILASENCNQIFISGHIEYDVTTLADEYRRDLAKGEGPAIPYNYFPDNNPWNAPAFTWRMPAELLFSNWLKIIC